MVLCRNRRADDFSPGRHNREAAHEQQGQGLSSFFLSLPLLFPHQPPKQASASNLSTIIFREHAAAPLGRRLMSLFPGLGYAAGYKVAQRVYKFGGQPYFNDFIVQNYRSSFTNAFGERKGKMMMQATAGSLTGIGEVVSACAAGCLPVCALVFTECWM